jgi:hypothetical protein
MIHYVVPARRAFTFRYFIEDWADADRFTILAAEQFIRQRRFGAGTYVFAVDGIEPAEGRLFAAMWDQLADAAPRVQVMNHPARTMGRFELLTAMAETKGNAFRAVRATDWPVSLRYPVFIRERERHNGSLTALLHSQADVARTLRWLSMKGFRRADLLVVEYCDTADAQGVYRKYSAYVVGDRIVPRAIEFGGKWLVKHDIRMFDDARIREEYEYVTRNPHEEWLRDAFALAGVTYGRADYALKDGVPQLFEINLNPTVGRFRPKGQDPEETLRLRAKRRATNEAFYAGFNAAWQTLDAKTAPAELIAISVDASLAAAAAAAGRQRHRNDRLREGIARFTSGTAVAAAVRTLRRLYLHRESERR